MNDGGNTDSTDREGAGWYFFVSYAQADQPWAEWIAWTLEEAGYRVLVQDWDLTPGSHRVQWIHEGVQRAEQTIIVLSEEYTRSVYGTAEWQTAWAADPAGQTRKLLVARVADCAPPGLLAQIVPVDLFGLPEQQTQATLLRAARLAVSGARAKPDTKPPLPSGRQAMPGQPAFPGDRPEVWNIPPRLAHFVGRTDLLDQLHHDLTVAATVSVCAVRGLGGVGKTALAIEYAYRNAEAFEVAWWIPAEDPELIPDHLATLATALGLTPDADADWPTIHTHLRREQRRWLLILDNVEHPDVIDPFRPTDTLGRLVITTRRTGLARHGTTLNLQELTRPEAVDLLTRRVPHITPDTADTIADLLGDLPLAVEQAAGYLDQTGTPPDHYIAMLTDQLGDMLHRGHIPDRPHTTLATLWNHSLTQLITHHPAATTLLDLCALCAPDPIPLTLLTDRPDLVPDPGLRHAAEHPPIWNDTVGALVGYGLAHRDGSSLTLHRLTTAAIRTHMTPTTHTSTATTLAALLTDALPEDIDGHPQNWPQWRQLLPHVRALLDHHPDTIWSNNSQSAAWLADRTGIYLGHHGRPDTAIPYHQRALNLTETHLGPHHPDTLTSRNNLARAYQQAGRLDQAIPLLERTLTDRETHLGPHHPDTLTSRSNLARAYRRAGRLDQAISLFDRTLTDLETHLGPHHRDTLASRGNLALAYQQAGRLDQAIPLHERTLTDLETHLGPHHPDTLISRNNLANAYQDAGQLDQAISLFDRTLTDLETHLGPHHPDTLTNRGNLATAYQDAGQLDQAIPLHKRTLTDSETHLGPHHPDTLISRNNLALAYQQAERLDQAIPLFERTLTDRETHLGPHHPDTLISRNNLALAYQQAERLDQAIPLFERTLTDRETHLGPHHPDTLISRNNLATAYEDAGRLDQAIPLFERTLTEAERILDPAHPLLAAFRANLDHARKTARPRGFLRRRR